MNLSESALSSRSDTDQQLTLNFDDRHWRVRGLEKQLSCERLRVNLMVSRRDLVHVDTLDLYVARQRKMFIKEAAAELYCEEATIKQDVGRVLLQLESQQDALIREAFAREDPEVPPMTDRERQDALDLLHDPQLIEQILQDFEACGLVGEETSKLVCYLACVSRHLPHPLAVLVHSSSAAGKTTLQDAVLRFMPGEDQVRLSTLTAQSLYYMGRDKLKHKILAVAEEDGVAQAAYALKLLQSEGRLSIACAGKSGDTGRQQTLLYEVEGPVAMLLTTTAETPHPELANRCLVVSANEQAGQTAAIHQRQRTSYQGQRAGANGKSLAARQQRAQRLLQPMRVVIPWAEQLTFRTDQVRYRRDHAKYLVLIASVTLLHQFQRKQFTRTEHGVPQQYVVATLDDLELANRLAAEVMCEQADSLMPQTRGLLSELCQYVQQRATADQVPQSAVRFTQRELREALQRSDRSLRRHLARLVELEYVLAYRTGAGNQRAYQLLGDAGAGGHCAATALGLVDVEQLRKHAPRENQ